MDRLNFFKVGAARIVAAHPAWRVKQRSTQRKRRLLFEALHERMVLATVTWDGGAGTFNWNDADNWDSNMLPGASDDVVIGDLSGTPTITVSATTSVQSVAAAEKVAFAPGITFTTSQLSTYSGGVDLVGGTFSPNLGANIDGSSTWTAGNIVGSGSGAISLYGSMAFSGVSSRSAQAVAIINHGTFTQTGGQLNLNNTVLTNASAATFAITTTANPAITGTGQIDNSGLITSAATTSISLNNYNNLSGGEIRVLSGTLSLPASGSHAGTFTADAGATMNIQNGTMTLNTGTSFGGGGSINLFGGTYNVTDDISGTNLNLSFAANFMNISDGKTFTLSGNNTLAGANFSNVVTATGTLRNTGTLTVTGAVGVNRGILSNAGTLSATTASATVTVGTGASIINEAAGTYELLSTGGIQGPTGSFVNHGILHRAGSGTAPINAPTTGTGAITVSSGVLDFQRGGTFESDITTAAGATTRFGNSFAYTFQTGTSFLDAGTVEFANGTFNFTDDVTASSNVAMSSSFGTVNVSAGKTFGWTGSANSIAGGALAGAGSIVNSGVLTISGTSLSNALVLTNATAGIVEVTNNLTLSGAGSIVNQGAWRRTMLSGTATVANAFSNPGTVDVQSGTLTLSGVVSQATTSTLVAGTWIADTGTLNLSSSPSLTTIGAAAVVQTNGNRFPKLAALATNHGSFTVTSGGSFTTAGALDNQGVITIPSAATLTVHSSGSLTNSGTLTLEGGNLTASTINNPVGGVIAGSGAIQGTVVSDGGTIGNADGPGTLSIVGAYQQTSQSEVSIELGGATAGVGYDQLNVSGTVSLGGTLHVSVVENYVGNQTFTIVQNDGNDPVSGSFAGLPEAATITLGASVLQISYVGGDGNDVVLTANDVDVFAVTNNTDASTGSLRQAILDANLSPALDTIVFNLAGPGPHSIQPSSALPAITGPVFIDGWSLPSYVDAPLIELDGTNAGAAVAGLTLATGSDGSTLRGLIINRFAGDGIEVISDSNTIAGNFIGTDASGNADSGNAGNGVSLQQGASNTTVGGSSAAQRNVISGNEGSGIVITDWSHSFSVSTFDEDSDLIVTGETVHAAYNFGGASSDGQAPDHPHQDVSVNGLLHTASNTGMQIPTLAGSLADPVSFGSLSLDAQKLLNQVAGRPTPLSLTTSGLVVGREYLLQIYFATEDVGRTIELTAEGRSSGALFTTASDELPRILSFRWVAQDDTLNAFVANSGLDGNAFISGYSVQAIASDPLDHVISGNYIGLDVTGTVDLGNANHGIYFGPGGAGNRIGTNADGISDADERNVISGNSGDGIRFDGASSAQNVVAGNYIGTNAAGTADHGNSGAGVYLLTSNLNTVGGLDVASGNVISGNDSSGIHVQGRGNHRFQGNTIGLNASGNAAIGNTGHGISIAHAAGNLVGGNDQADGIVDGVVQARNVIGGNSQAGIYVFGYGPHTIAGNVIGLNAAGSSPVPNLDGIHLGATFDILIGGSTPGSGNTISGNTRYGILGDSNNGSSGQTIQGNIVGLDITGVVDLGNGSDGISLTAHPNSRIGGELPGEGNVISGNQGRGIFLGNSSPAFINTIVAGNVIGTDVTGMLDRGNSGHGIEIVAGGNTIGGQTLGARNLISGNNGSGIWISGGSSGNNVVEGNYIGTDASGALALSNGGRGVEIGGGSKSNRIGTDADGTNDANERNLISGNASDGIRLVDLGTDNNVVAGNFIGTNAAGTAAIGNLGGGGGIFVLNGPANTLIGGLAPGAGNVISGNSGSSGEGIEVELADGTMIYGNIIGLDASGMFDLGNSQAGVFLDRATGTRVGGATPAHRNVISGNNASYAAGVWMNLAQAAGNRVQGNYIGTNITGTAAVPNAGPGVRLSGGANANFIGTDGDGVDDASEGNLISGNFAEGVLITGNGSDNNLVAGNFIGTNAAGTAVLGNVTSGVRLVSGAKDNRIGGASVAYRNIISGNNLAGSYGSAGVAVAGAASSGNLIQGNYIGLDVTGTVDLGNGEGIYTEGANTTIGGLTATPGTGPGNVISGNGAGPGWLGNVHVRDAGASGTEILGNLIGTNATGTAAIDLTHSQYGVYLESSQNVTVGGTTTDARNVISGQTHHGVVLNRNPSGMASDNRISGNYIGTNIDGTAAIGNLLGVVLADGSVNNTIGGLTAAERNVISGNRERGVQIAGGATSGNVVQGNYIGTNAQGTAALGNASDGVWVMSANNLIGGSVAAAGNLVSGNGWNGINVQYGSATGNKVQGNYVGLNAAGTAAIANANHGVLVWGGASDTIIGTDGDGSGDAGEGNVISGNVWDGVSFWSGGANNTVVAGNRIGTTADGLSRLPHGRYGVWVTQGTFNTRIGTNSDGISDERERNIISGGGADGVRVDVPGDTNTVIAGNFIGTDVNGASTIQNTLALYRGDGTAADSVGDNVTGNLLNGTTYAAGHVGQAFDLDGVDDAVALSTTTLHSAYTALSIEGWVYPREHGTDAGGLWGKTIISRSDDDGFALRLHNGNIQADLRLSNGHFSPTFSSQVVALNQWSHVAMTYDGANIRAYLNGALIGTSAASGAVRTAANAGTVTMLGNEPQGASVQAGGFGFNGWIDELGVYNRGLATWEVQQIAGFGSSGRPQAKDLGNRGYGVVVYNGSSGSRIGSDGDGVHDAAERNVIARSGSHGVYILGANTDDNVIAGNYIGTDAAGALAQGNLASGVYVLNGPENTQVGLPGAGNVISANGWTGVDIIGLGTDHTFVAGNRIGTDASGTQDLGNMIHGVAVFGQAKDTIVGTDGDGLGDLAEGNVISGNQGWTGVLVSGTGTDRTIFAGNYVGLNAAGTAAIGNNGTSIAVNAGAVGTRIGTDGDGVSDIAERNVLSGNVWEVLVEGLGTDGTVIAGNFIGTNAAGDAAIPNSAGITVRFGPKNTRIGTDGSNDAFNENERNVVSGNSSVGIRVSTPYYTGEMPAGGGTTDGTIIAGNYIGLNASGTAPLGNLSAGIVASQMPTNLRIGSDGDGIADQAERNIISGNGGNGIQVEGWSQMNVLTAEQLISGAIPRTAVTSTVAQADFRDATAAGAGGNSTYDHAIPGGGGDYYVMLATGLLQVNTAGTYSFALGSDDGGRLRINGADVIVDNTNHAFDSRFGSVTLSAGTHTFEWLGYEGGGASGFELAVAIGGGMTGPVTTANGWRLLGAADPHSKIALQGNITATAYYADPPSLEMQIAGNYIGTDPSGTLDMGNGGDGIRLLARTRDVVIGGQTASLRNVISGNNNDGIEIVGGGSSGNVIAGNYIGTDATGTVDLGNSIVGVRVGSAAGNTIGGASPTLRNLISGNNSQGIVVTGVGADNNVVVGNYIGTDVSGELAIGNGTSTNLASSMGIFIGNGAQSNRVGTDGDGVNDTAERNLISGNASDGIKIQTNSSFNVVAGNFIGTNQDGTRALGNGRSGVFIQSTGLNRVGTDSNGVGDNAERNVIAANASHGVWIMTAGANGNLIAGNFIGTDVTGTSDLGNGLDGVSLQDGSVGNVIGGSAVSARNIISGNARNGVEMNGATTTGNVVIGNFIGLGTLGSVSVGNTVNGVFIQGGAKNNRIGTDGDGVNDGQERNVISGNASGVNANVNIIGATTMNNIVAGNYIGTTADGSTGLVNAGRGVRIASGASFNRIGTDGSDDAFNASERNVISGHSSIGVFVAGNANDNSIAGNYIGLNAAGTAAIANASYGIDIDGSSRTRIGTNSDGMADLDEGNVISGSGDIGVIIVNSTLNVVAGNRIGTNAAGTTAIPNTTAGLALVDGSTNNLIGGTELRSGNLISGNSGAGIWLVRTFAGTTYDPSPDNTIQGNRIGTDATGMLDLGNTGDGIRIEEPGTTIGGATAAARNVISGNDAAGIVISGTAAASNSIQGNYVGINAAGIAPLANSGDGIRIENDSPGNQIGGNAETERNIISGNSASGVFVVGAGAGNRIQGNYIGTDSTGSFAIGNASTVDTSAAGVLVSSTSGNTVLIGTDGDGLNDADEGNMISGNFRFGVRLQGGSDDSGSHIVSGNRIGVDASGTAALPNQAGGINILTSSHNRIGTNADGVSDALEANIISGNRNLGGNPAGAQPAYGILISDSNPSDSQSASHNTIAGNSIGTDASRSFDVGNQAAGILISDALDNVVGGGVAAAANVIAYNGTGVAVVGSSRGNSIRGNSLSNNLGLGIDLGADGVTANDPGDADGGPNDQQNYPLLSAPTSGAQTRVVGQLESTPGTAFDIDFYASSVIDPSGYGEGKRYLGTISVTTNLSGVATFEELVSGVSVEGDLITAVAIDPAGNTSEFSAGVIASADSDASPTVDSSNLILTAASDEDAFGVPSQVFAEGSIVRLDGLFANLDSTDGHTVQIDWGDGSPLTNLVVAPGPRGFAASHLYADDRPTGTAQDTYTIEIFVTDDDNSSGRAAIDVTIVNTVASLDTLPVISSLQASEGDSLVLTGSFIDPGEDLHRLLINWGDGSPTQTVPLELGSRTFAVPHSFINESSQVSVTLIDDDTVAPQMAQSVTLFVDVRNTAPVPIFDLPATSVEGTPLSLLAGANDPGVGDLVTFEWTVSRDGSPILQATGPALAYTPPNEGVYRFELIATDQRGASGSFVQSTTVANFAPTVDSESLIVSAPGGSPTFASVPEGSPFEIHGSFVDPGLDDAHVVTIEWGDGSPATTLQLAPGLTSFVATHHYLDDGASGAGSAAYPISVMVDDGMADDSVNSEITVSNVAPTVSIVDNGSDDTTIRLRTVVQDDSLQDTFTYQWNVTGASLPTGVALNQSTLEFPRTASDFAEVGVTVTDDDLGVATALAVIVLGSSRADTITVSASPGGDVTVEVTSDTNTSSADFTPSGVILVAAQDGNDAIIIDASVTVATFIDAGGGDDTVTSGSGADTVSGGLGNDLINAGEGNNVIDISEGNDTSISGGGDDVIRIYGFSDKTINDSGGSDVLDFSGVYASTTLDEGVALDLTLDDGQRQTVRSDGSLALAGTFESVVGSQFNDKFTGNGADNYIAGMDGEDLLFGGDGSDDTLDGGSGDDSIVGSNGNDLIFGGDGEDTIESGSGEQSISAGSGNDLIFGGGELDDTLDGGSGDDSIVGSDGNDLIFGGDGQDTIEGGSGEQSIAGGSGNDLIFGGGDGDATMDGGSGDDSIRGSNGNDLIFGGDGEDTIVAGSGDQTLSGGTGNDLIFGSDGDDTFAGGGEDSILGSDGNDLIFGGDGDDTLVGGSGDETLSGGSGNDLIFGGDGDDTFAGGADDSLAAGDGNDLIFGGDGDDTMVGGDGDQSIDGGAGNDLIFGGDESDDTLQGGLGDDSIVGSTGNDLIFGGSGDDTIESGSGDQTIVGGSGNDLIFGGDGSDDTLESGSGDQSISGGAGNDLIFGGDGSDDTLDGGRGNDSIVGGSGNDLIFGGDGDDTVEAGSGDQSISGGAGNDLIFGGDGSDATLDGGSGDDSIVGGTGNDLIFGGDDDDTLQAGSGDQSISGGDGNDLIFGADGSDDTLDGGSGEDSIVAGDGNGLIFGGDGDDTLVGGSGEQTLAGGTGNDLIFGGGSDDDTLSSGSGDDTLLGGSGDQSISGGAGNDLIFGSDGGDDTLDGGSGDDSIVGSSGNDLIFGGADDDTLLAGDGDQSLSGGDGNDLIFGGDGSDDTLSGGGGDDSIIGSDGNDLIFGSDGDDTIESGSGDTSIDGGGGNDLIFGGSGDDTIDGSGGDDSIVGSHGNDLIFGGDGDDTFSSGDGDDSLVGGAGNDLIYSAVSAHATFTANQLVTDGGSMLHFTGFESAALYGDDEANRIDGSAATIPLYLVGGGGDDTLLGGSQDDRLDGGGGNNLLRGNDGDDTYRFSEGGDGVVTIDESESHGDDTLDFLAFASGITVDLAESSLQFSTASLGLSLIGDIENVLGSAFNDKLYGNSLDNKLYGGAGDDELFGRDGNDTIAAGFTRMVYLDFDTLTELGEHVYTASQRDEIQQRMEADYALFDIGFTQTRPAEGPFITVVFNAAVYLPGSRLALGGISERIGWRELTGSGTVRVDVNGFLGTGINKLPGTHENFVALSSTIAAHELAHMYGLGHADSFGAPGAGIYSGRNLHSRFRPVYSGPVAAAETRLHLLASPASVGTSLIDALGNPFFGEREAIKLAFAESGYVVAETQTSEKVDAAGLPALTQVLGELPALSVPNPVVTGINQGQALDVAAINVTGEIQLTDAGVSESDYYSFTGRAGDLMTIEVLSDTLRHRIPNTIDSLLRVYDSNGQKVAYYGSPLGAFNDDLFEPTDSLIIDLVLPADGTYTIEVDTFSFATPEFPVYQPNFDIEAFSAANPTNLYVTDRDTGQYELFIYRVGGVQVPQVSGGDTLVGGAGADVLIGNSGRETIIGFNSTEDQRIDSSGESFLTGSPPTLAPVTVPPAVEGSEVRFTAVGNDVDGEILTYRLESVAGMPFPLGATMDPSTGQFHFLPGDDGTFAVRVIVEDETDESAFQEVLISVGNEAPAVNAGIDETGTEGDEIALLGSFTDAGLLDTHFAVWTVTGPDGDVVATGNDLSIAFTPPDNGIYTASLAVTDDDGATTTDVALITIDNAAPAVDAGIDQSGTEGNAVTLSGLFVDAGVLDTHSIAWTIQGPGDEVVATGDDLSITFTPPDDGIYTASLTITDNDGASTTDVALINVENAPPVVTSLVVSTGAVLGQVELSGAFTDVGIADGHTAFVDWGDGVTQPIAVVPSPGGGLLAASHFYGASGTYTVTVTITDDDNGAVLQTVLVEVSAISVSDGELRVLGTTSDDVIRVYQLFEIYAVYASFLPGIGIQFFSASQIDRLHIAGSEGNDSIDVSLFVTDSTVILGGPGNDTLHGGFGDDWIDGGSGDDTIFGRTGNDILIGAAGSDTLDGGHGGDLMIGGLGADLLAGDQGEDILIGGYTSFDHHQEALLGIVAEWNSTRTFATRVKNISGSGTSPGLNGTYFLKVDQTVFGDSEEDRLEGEAGKDWFFASLAGEIDDIKPNEVLELESS